jgi:hypothetical protein
MARKSIAMIFFSVLLFSTLPLLAPTANAQADPPSTGISDCNLTRTPSGVNSLSTFHWNYTSESTLMEEFVNSSDPNFDHFVRVYVREVTGLINYSTQAIYPGNPLSVYKQIYLNAFSLIFPTQQNPIIEYEILLVNQSNTWSTWLEHPDSCIVTLDYESGEWEVETVNVDFNMTYYPPIGEVGNGSYSSVDFSYDSAPIVESDVIGYYVNTYGIYQTTGVRTNVQNYWSNQQFGNSSPANIWWGQGNNTQWRHSYIDESESSTLSLGNYQGIFTAELVAFDHYGNTAVVATESIELSKSVPIFETCSIDFNKDADLLEVGWDISPYSTSYDSGEYHVSIIEPAYTSPPWGEPQQITVVQPFFNSESFVVD